jgi:hypothetical protein
MAGGSRVVKILLADGGAINKTGHVLLEGGSFS